MPQAPEASFAKLVATVHRLRQECPWDREQTTRSILPHLLEEAYEALEALEKGPPEEACEELGDLLLQVLFHCELAAERGDFGLEDVVQRLREKLVRRHPHVFGEAEARTAQEVLRNWSRIKAAERRDDGGTPASVLDGVPSSLPALLRAERYAEKASRVGFDWPDAASVLPKIREELGELQSALASGDTGAVERELGDLLFALASFGRKTGTSAEIALRRASDRFRERFVRMEERLRRQGRDIHGATPAELEELWRHPEVRGTD
jgi:ATP diphosphatase